MNLLEETIQILKDTGHEPAEVQWVGRKDFGWFTWEEFAALANTEYDNGYGANEIPLGLLVVGDGWWLERHEYDGSEWWEYKSQPKKPEQHRVPISIIECDYPYEWVELR